MLYLGLLAIVPLLACFAKASSLSLSEFVAAVWTPRALAAYRFSIGVSLASACTSIVLGFVIAWVLVRYEFPLKRFFDALIDLPFALPTAVSGIALTAIYSRNGWIGQYLEPLGIKVAFTPLGVIVALTFRSLRIA